MNIKSEKTSEWIRILSYKKFHQLCFSNRDQILATFIKKHCPVCTAWRFLISQGHFYILNFWHFSIRKINAIIFMWKNWHRRLEHFNMQNVKKLININLISNNENDFIEKYEICIMKKMHRKSNHQSVRINRRANRSSQRFHTNLIDDKKIVLISRNKRYAIIFVNDFSNYIWIYLMRKKMNFRKFFAILSK